MRPRKEKDDKRKRKSTKRSKLLKKSRNNNFCYLHNVNFSIDSSGIESFNDIIRDHKSQVKDVKRTWKVVPKDSCEVYKDRRKRKFEKVPKKESREKNYEPDTNEENKSVKKRAKRRPLKRDSRGRFLPESSSSRCSCSDCGESEVGSDD